MRSTQNENGTISGWIESTQHPQHNVMGQDDPLLYYSSTPMRKTNADYAAIAALLSRLIKPFNASLSDDLRNSAIRAYQWANNSNNKIQNLQFQIINNNIQQTIVFDEKPETSSEELMQARLQLYLTTQEQTYLDEFNNTDVFIANKPASRGMASVSSWLSSYPDENSMRFTSIIKYKNLFVNEFGTYKNAVIKQCEDLMLGMEESAYRHFWRKKDHGWFQNLSWGEAHPMKRARCAVAAMFATNDIKYRDVLELALDYQLGANPLGKSMTTGLGTIFPALFQHIFSELDSRVEPVPGYSPYTFTYGIDYYVGLYQLAFIDKGTYSGYKLVINQLADEFGPEVQTTLEGFLTDSDTSKYLRDLVDKSYPIFRRNFPHFILSPSQNEFTVHESIAAHIPVYGALLEPGWKPTQRELNRQPIADKDLPWYYQP